ncbi:MAG: hypothetical protein CME65_13965 [Halobacteriovoraceae bacterium]|nr:hypothetical protein [Halobacteriovoraceae bacterium]|tara:strand:- start:1073 stop:1600 length:528 start_codon:yes stop_codon:yes gene_type:complete
MQKLKGHHKNPENPEFKVEYGIVGDEFKVSGSYEGKLYVSDDFKVEGFDNWLLWEFDVFELFLTRGHPQGHYLEIQFSPLGQKLALLIKRPREDFDFYVPKTFKLENTIDDQGWKFKCTIKATDIPGSDSIIHGNLHSCIHKAPSRCYLGTEINKEDVPDFHRPELFIKLGEFNG